MFGVEHLRKALQDENEKILAALLDVVAELKKINEQLAKQNRSKPNTGPR